MVPDPDPDEELEVKEAGGTREGLSPAARTELAPRAIKRGSERNFMAIRLQVGCNESSATDAETLRLYLGSIYILWRWRCSNFALW